MGSLQTFVQEDHMIKKQLSILLILAMLLSVAGGALASAFELEGSFVVDLLKRDYDCVDLKLSGNYTDSFYDQLNEEERYFYGVREESIAYIRNDESDEFAFDVPFDIKIESFVAAFFNAAFAFDFDRPDVFWLNKAVHVSYTYNSISQMVTGASIVEPDGGWYCAYDSSEEVIAAEEQFWAKVDQLVAAAPSGYIQRVRYFHDWLVLNNDYNTYVAEGDIESASGLAWSAAGALIGNPNSFQDDPVCEGYSRAFKVLLDEVGIPCALISGLGDGGAHMWTYVKMPNGNWYAVDVTWDDNGGDEPRTRYFLRGSSFFFRDHTEDGNITEHGTYAYPVLSANDYESEAKHEMGDVNMDGEVNTGDASALLRFCAGIDALDADQMVLADFNGDMNIDTGDASAILVYIAFGE